MRGFLELVESGELSGSFDSPHDASKHSGSLAATRRHDSSGSAKLEEPSCEFSEDSSHSLVARLRQADSLAQIVNERRYQQQLSSIYKNSSATVTSVQELGVLLQKMANEFRFFDTDNALKLSYLQTVRANSLVWDDISSENNRKLVLCIRSAVELVRKLHKANQKNLKHHLNRVGSASTVSRSSGDLMETLLIQLEALVNSTRIFSDSEKDLFPVELLFAVMQECTRQLQAIRDFNLELQRDTANNEALELYG